MKHKEKPTESEMRDEIRYYCRTRTKTFCRSICNGRRYCKGDIEDLGNKNLENLWRLVNGSLNAEERYLS